MAQSITLQTSDTAIVSGDNIGRLSFAASSEASAGDSTKIAASIYAEAEGEFTSTANSTSLVFATAASDSATGQYRITSVGHFEPLTSISQNLGSASKVFNTLYVDNIQAVSQGIVLSNNTPSITTNALYNVGGQLYFNGSAISGGSSSGTTAYDWKLSANSGATLTITSGTIVNFTGLGNINITRNGSDIIVSGSSSQSTGGGTPGGSDTNIQYNSSGSFAGSSRLTWNNANTALTVSGSTSLIHTGLIFAVKNTGDATLFSVTDNGSTNFVIAAQPGQTTNPFEIKDEFNTTKFFIDINGNISGARITGTSIVGTSIVGTINISGSSITGTNIRAISSITGDTINAGTSIIAPSIRGTINVSGAIVSGTSIVGIRNISGSIISGGDIFSECISGGVITGTNIVGLTSISGSTISGNIIRANDIFVNSDLVYSGMVRQTIERSNTGTGMAVILENNNHQTINTSGASTNVTVTLNAPSGSSAGTLIVRQFTPRNITWNTNSGVIYWMGTRPTWSGDPTGTIRLVAWRWDNTNFYLAATETGRL